ncbi:NAD(P)/FAD-dependent oxidoreductase [Celeribacter indicus]|uniref:Ferredoxin reductase n=1 Tax=Celeribacter indicus TaxID=1208324 RepID=A0A0B5E1F8_9RHOB|nr:FAD-dependent oxidoreductase [Celeribacter indicus]AJE49473.1 ferredoxin reductase [Celeribacter indicus]SDX57216.1 3-phenylpropionate/trans-cinnamate dioxygenase ferredoxin reductase subunit [Celeribacter indicus]
MKVLIVGAGQAGVNVAHSLRQEGFDGSITILGDEPDLPYMRPPLSKGFIADGDTARIAIKPEGFYLKSNIKLVRNVRVASIDRAGRHVQAVDGRQFAYDHLVLATGARNAPPPIENLDSEGVVSLRSLRDATDIRERLDAAHNVAVIGGGFIGLEFAAMATKRGIAVTIVEAMPRIMARAVTQETSDLVAASHEGNGTRILCDSRASAVLGPDHATGLGLSEGTTLRADLVLVAAGVKPNTELASDAGLSVSNGIDVDGQFLTSDPDISALGDCCCFPEPTRGARTRLESVQAANDQGRAIARRLCGRPQSYVALPWFWSDQGDLKLQIAGLSTGTDSTEVLERDGGGRVVSCFVGGRLVAVETINAPGDHIAARKLLSGPAPIDRLDLKAVGYDLRRLLKGHCQLAEAPGGV